MDKADDPGQTPNVVGCRLVGAAFAARKAAIARDLFAHADRVEEHADGYGWRFPAAVPWAERALAFVLAERECCPFFRFDLIVEPDDGPLWLWVGGAAEAKEFLAAEMGDAVSIPEHRPGIDPDGRTNGGDATTG